MIEYLKQILKKIFSTKLSVNYSFSFLKSGDLAIDAGANVGDITTLMAQQGASVYAFEPNPYAFEVLARRFKDQANVICQNQGVWDKQTTLPLYLHKNHEQDKIIWSVGSSMLDFKGNINPENSVMMQTVDLADFIINLPQRVKLLKMDIEGAEVETLNHLIDTGAINKIDYLLAETHEKKIPQLLEKTEQLKQRIKDLKLKNIDLNWR